MTATNDPLIPKVILGRSGILSTKLGLGTASWPHRITMDETILMLKTAFDAGIRHIDTAPFYQTEHIIGEALQNIDVPDDVVLATKAGRYSEASLGLKGKEYSADYFYRSIDRSLKRFGRDFIDIVHIHDAEPDQMQQVLAPGGAITALQDLKGQGVIGAIGLGAMYLDSLQIAAESGQFDVLQIFHIYTLLNQTAADKLFPICMEASISIFNSAPYAGYILATGAVPGAKYNYTPASTDVMEAVRRLEAACAQKGVDLPSAAVAFSASHPVVDVVVIASGKPKRVAQWVTAINLPLTDADYKDLLKAVNGQYELPHAL
jgi:D-threo-aldose 1-dehydrogenase